MALDALRRLPNRIGDYAGSVLASAVSTLLGTSSGNPLDTIQRQRGHDIESQERARRLQSQAEQANSTEAWITCAGAWFGLDQFDRALECFERALTIDARCSAALDGKATVLKTRGQLKEAISTYRQALDVEPSNMAAFQNLLFALLCSNDVDDAEILQWHRRFAQQFEQPFLQLRGGYKNTREPERRLRIGYLSADLRDHVTGRCMAPLLKRHDKRNFDVYCYFNGRLADDFTRTLKAAGGTWRDMSKLDDAQLCKQIKADRIDILVDLSGHTPGNRVLAVARKPAPVQVSYLDYSATTGLQAMDYRLTTEACDPVGTADAFYSEILQRLPGTYWLYNPPKLPHAQQEQEEKKEENKPYLLFSCLNSYYRICDEAIALWAGILRRVPNARLALVGVPAGHAQDEVLQRFGKLGVRPSRIELFGILNHGHYLQLVRATDIALAPFPYNGAMSMLDAMWHGVPVVSLGGGAAFRSRMGNCLLPLVDLQDLIAGNAAQYADVAVRLAQDASRRQELRAQLRDRMKRSPICDAPALTTAIEAAYRDAWRRFCAQNITP
jgi:predicted O-linked N-acetylglucosamine transferase (SPINDLY family)